MRLTVNVAKLALHHKTQRSILKSKCLFDLRRLIVSDVKLANEKVSMLKSQDYDR